jgi:hypothetical protein
MKRALIVRRIARRAVRRLRAATGGWDVQVIEARPGDWMGGARAGVLPAMLEVLKGAGARVDRSVGVPVSGRVTFARDGASGPGSRCRNTRPLGRGCIRC